MKDEITILDKIRDFKARNESLNTWVNSSDGRKEENTQIRQAYILQYNKTLVSIKELEWVLE